MQTSVYIEDSKDGVEVSSAGPRERSVEGNLGKGKHQAVAEKWFAEVREFIEIGLAGSITATIYLS